MVLGGEKLIGNTNWLHFSLLDLMSVKWTFFNSTLVKIFLFMLFSDQPTTPIPVKWDKRTSFLLFSFIL